MPLVSFAEALPKVQLHCHLEGTLEPVRFVALAERYGVDLGERARRAAAIVYAFQTFREFLLLFADVCKTLRTPSDFADLARDYVRSAVAQNVRYAELFVSPSVWTYFHRDLNVRATVEAMRSVFDSEGLPRGLRVALICDVTRNFGPDRALETAKIAASLRDLGVVGIGLGGDEANFPPVLFREAFAFARAAGLHCVAHAGEAAGPGSVRDAIDILHAERIGHGVRALEDDVLVDELVSRQIPLEICPTSNYRTGAVAEHSTHPIGALAARGVRCVIDADDPTLFSTTLCNEYTLVEEMLGRDAIVGCARDAIEASFASESVKVDLRAGLFEFLTSRGAESSAPGRI